MRKLANWLTSYLDYTKQQESPELFHLWSGISALASTIGRNVWLDRGFYKIFPNHYIIIVAASAKCKKSVAVGIAREILEKAKVVEIMAERITNASVLTELASVATLTGKSEMLVWADELATFLSKEETHKGIITTLTRLFTCPDLFINKLKTVPTDKLQNVCLNILAATTPSDLGELIPSSSTGKGFTPRLHLVYQSERRYKVADPVKDPKKEELLVEDLKHISTLKGEFQLTGEDRKWWHKWYDKLEFPEDEALDGFYGRKHDFMLKLGMIISLSERDDLTLKINDMDRASKILDQMETFMPSAYREIGRDPHSVHVDRVLRQIERRGGRVTKSEVLHDNWNKFTAKEWMEISYHLQESGDIEIVPGRPTVYILKKGR